MPTAPQRRSWKFLLRAAAAASVALLLAACASGPASPEASPAAAPASAPNPPGPFPPTGVIRLPFRPPPESGVYYRLLVTYDGEREVVPPPGHGDPIHAEDSRELELHFREDATPAPPGDAGATVFVLRALRTRLRAAPPSVDEQLELADDRLRIQKNGKTAVDLQGAQPRKNLTPRMLLDHPFALMRLGSDGSPRAILIRGTLPAQRFLRSLPLREALEWSQLAFPSGPILPGASWQARRHPASPAGQRGAAFELSYELAGFQRVDGVECAWILISADVDSEKVPSDLGFTFDRLVAHVEGQAWVALADSVVRKLTLKDDVRYAYPLETAASGTEERARYRSQTVLQIEPPDIRMERWADGSKLFERH